MEVMLNRSPKSMERGLDLAGGSKVPKSERPRSTWGSLEMSLQGTDGLCSKGRRCIRRDQHAGACWPS